MAALKFKFTVQPYQTAAVAAVADVFAGQPYSDAFSYRRDMGKRSEAERPQTIGQTMLPTEQEARAKAAEADSLGYANAPLLLTSGQLLANLHAVQAGNHLPESPALTTRLGACSLDVEMETGTGKTYVYIKTMFELNRRYGWSKFIVVVPSVAIREGVRKSFEQTADHFQEQYGKKARFFVYDSGNLSALDSYSQDAGIRVMIINMQAFNTSFNADKNKEGSGGNKAARVIFSERDSFGTRRPIDVIKANRPILIMDEPQKMGGDKTRAALKEFGPLFCLNYSATHKERHELVYALDAMDAYNQRLVKRIAVKGFEVRNLPGTGGYLFLEDTVPSTTKPPAARLEFEVWRQGGIKRETRLVKVDDDLFALSAKPEQHRLEQYRGYRVSEIDPRRQTVTFTNGVTLAVGELRNSSSDERDLRRLQIRETIRAHFAKERELFALGVKTLSLFFIDEVAKYRRYDADGNETNSEYGEIFEREYTDALNEQLTLDLDEPYQRYLRGIGTQETHAGYFSVDKKTGRKVDSAVKRGNEGSDDISAYDLILRDKERLLSLKNPVRFIFSHSALREGWDNPNVFQICALKPGGSSPTQKRQEVGRGLRLCVNQQGERMDLAALGNRVQEVNRLTVIASEGYAAFVGGLQRGISAGLRERPRAATAEYFAGKTVAAADGATVAISAAQARDIYKYLLKNDYVEDNDAVSGKYREDDAGGTLAPLPASCAAIADGVRALVRGFYDPSALEGMIGDANAPTITDNALNEKFYQKEFQALWRHINHKHAYTVAFESAELVDKAAAHLDANLSVARLRVIVTDGEQAERWTREQLKDKGGFVQQRHRTVTLARAGGSRVRYDLVGKIAGGTRLTRRTVAKILARVKPKTFAMFQANPEEFIAKAARLIDEQKDAMVVEHVTYNRLDGAYDSEIFTATQHADFAGAYRAAKNVQPWVFTDGSGVERRFAEAMDKAAEVRVYAKLPKEFAIPTPMGNYSPDWAIVFDEKAVKHIYFVAETKGSMSTLDLRGKEEAKIECAKRLFSQLPAEGVAYGVVKSYEKLMEIVGG